MAKYRHRLPQIGDKMFLTDAGIETTLIFHDKLDLPLFASFILLKDSDGTEALRRYYRRHAAIAQANATGFVLESATWRASADWGARLGYGQDDLDEANRKAIALLHELREEFETPESPMVISGNIGPRGDGYDPGTVMTADAAQGFHARQAEVFAESGADMVTAATMTNTPEAIGIVRAAKAVGMPVAISFTVETDGRLPTGETLGEAIEAVDAATGAYPVYFMINCAHPTHFEDALADGEAWTARIGGIRANASRLSHAELDEATELDDGDPAEFGRQYRDLRRRFRGINVLGGCCGTDHRHIASVLDACRVAA
jgi:S-methylmethionine-dependent homocysteine/selenocysteine methylase